jgi:hypothetical protein
VLFLQSSPRGSPAPCPGQTPYCVLYPTWGSRPPKRGCLAPRSVFRACLSLCVFVECQGQRAPLSGPWRSQRDRHVPCRRRPPWDSSPNGQVVPTFPPGHKVHPVLLRTGAPPAPGAGWVGALLRLHLGLLQHLLEFCCCSLGSLL